MRIVFIAPGLLPIPPDGWGALETVVWNQSQQLEKLGVETHVINYTEPKEVNACVKFLQPDIIHLHYGKHYELMPQFDCRKIVTNHDGSFRFSGQFHDMVVRKYLYDCEFFCLSEYERQFFTRIGISKNKVKILPNGVNTEDYRMGVGYPMLDRSIYLGKIDERKRQHLFQKRGLNIDFAGTIATDKFDKEDSCYLGEWTSQNVKDGLARYANLVILSSSENCAPLVCLEAMSAGIGIVISEACTESLDLSKKFITVIPESKISDYEYVGKAIQENREYSLTHRPEILEYIKSRDWSEMAKKYLSYL